MKALANEVYNSLLDLDFMDNEETKEKDVENLLNDLKLLESKGNGSLLNAIQMLVEN